MRVVSRLSSGVSGGRIVGSRRASIVLPEPGEPSMMTLCAAGRGHRERPLGELLPLHVGEVDVVLVELPFHLVGRRRDRLEVGRLP